jgi:uncharacterized surface protein with fasciclin (FAS1) repeats
MRFRVVAAAAAAVGSSLATVACSGATVVAPRSGASVLAARPPRASSDRPFGTGCAQLPRIRRGGTQRGLPNLPVATAIAQTPQLSELSKAITLAGLARMLNTARALTVFAPDNAAFAELGPGNLQALFTTRSDLAPVLKFQIVAGRVRPAELARQRVLTTIAGTRIYPARAKPSYYVNNAYITCGNLRTANATVYIINQVIVPST